MTWFTLSVEDMDGSSLKESATRQVLRDWLACRALEEGDLFGTLAMMRNRSEKLTIVPTDVTLGGTRELHRVRDQRVEHRLELTGRACDVAQDFSRGRFLFSTFRKFSLTGFKLFGETLYFFFELTEAGSARTLFLL
jgi:hypothetical protein